MKLTQAILPVAGLGTRFLPWTKVVPKEMLPIGSQPIIAHLVDECLDVGINDICFVISHGKEIIPQYFYADPALEVELRRRGKEHALAELHRYNDVNLHVVYQEEQRGDGHAILQAKEWVKSPVVAILFGDDLIVGEEKGLAQLVKAYEHLPAHDKHVPLLCLENVPREMTCKYGIVDIDHAHTKGNVRKIKGLVEKPSPDEAPSTLGIVGKYLIPKETFAVLPDVEGGHGGEIRLIDALISMLEHTPVYGIEAEGKRIDTGTPEGYKEAVKLLG